MLRIPESRPKAESPLSATILEWERLVNERAGIAMYRESLGTAYRVRGTIKAGDKRWEAAEKDFEESRKVLDVLTQKWPQLPSSHAELGRTCLELGRLARTTNNPAARDTWFAKATEELARAVQMSPDNMRDRRSLKEVSQQR
jgi:hypothetical protein